jgi:hypothetical protein
MQPHDDLDRIARKRASAKMGWYIHALVYLAINVLLAVLSAASGRHWAVFPAMGWGLGLTIHGIVVWVFTGAGGLHQRLVERERARLTLQRDPW